MWIWYTVKITSTVLLFFFSLKKLQFGILSSEKTQFVKYKFKAIRVNERDSAECTMIAAKWPYIECSKSSRNVVFYPKSRCYKSTNTSISQKEILCLMNWCADVVRLIYFNLFIQNCNSFLQFWENEKFSREKGWI